MKKILELEEKLKKAKAELEKTGDDSSHPSNDLGAHHAKVIHAGLSLLGHKGHSVTNENKDFSGMHVQFDSKDQNDNSDDIHSVLSAHGIKHGGAMQNEDEDGDYGHEHFIHPKAKESLEKGMFGLGGSSTSGQAKGKDSAMKTELVKFDANGQWSLAKGSEQKFKLDAAIDAHDTATENIGNPSRTDVPKDKRNAKFGGKGSEKLKTAPVKPEKK